MASGVRVVVIDFNGADVLPACLNSLTETINVDIPISVLDNASPTPAKTLIPDKLKDRVEVTQLGKNNGYAGGIAYAWDNFDEEFLIICNNDLEFTPGWLDKLVETAESSGAHAVSALIQHEDETELQKTTNASLNPLFYLIDGVFTDRTKAVYPSGACFLLRNDKSIRCPVDPDYFLYYEDVYIGLFLRAIGKIVVQCPESVVKHAGSHAVSKESKKMIAWYQERNRLLTQVLFTRKRDMVKLYPCSWYDSNMLPFSCYVRKKPYFTLISARWWFFFKSWKVWMKKQDLKNAPGFDPTRNYPYFSGKFYPDRIRGSRVINKLAKWWWRLVGIPVDREAGK